MPQTCVKTFCLALPRTPENFSIQTLEASILAELPNLQRLLRWAIVRYDQKQLTIEGAYLSLYSL